MVHIGRRGGEGDLSSFCHFFFFTQNKGGGLGPSPSSLQNRRNFVLHILGEQRRRQGERKAVDPPVMTSAIDQGLSFHCLKQQRALFG